MSSSDNEEEVQFTFTEQQLVILHEEKDSYRDTNKKLRQKKVNEIYKRMKTTENEDREFNSKKDVVQAVSWGILGEYTPLHRPFSFYLKAILAWLQRYARRKTEEKGFLEPWTLRRVVGIECEQEVLRIRDRKFAEAQRSDSAKKTADESGTDGDDEDESGGKNKKGKDNRKRDKAFNYYQAALTEVVENLTEEETDEMQELAKTWNENGPPLDTRRK